MAHTHALLQTSTLDVLERVDAATRFRTGEPPLLQPEKDMHWVPYIYAEEPSFDPLTQVRSKPVEAVTKHEITNTVTVRQMNAAERAARDSHNDNDYIIEEAKTKAMWVLIELIDELLDQEIITASNFTPKVRKAYRDLKERVDRAKV